MQFLLDLIRCERADRASRDRARVEEQRRQTQQARHDQCRGNRDRSGDQPDARPTRRLADRVGLRADRVDRGAGLRVQTLVDPCREHGFPHAPQGAHEPEQPEREPEARRQCERHGRDDQHQVDDRQHPGHRGVPLQVHPGLHDRQGADAEQQRAPSRMPNHTGARARPPTAARCLPAGADRSGGRNPRSTCHAARLCRGSAAARGGPAPRPRPRAPSWRTCAGARLHDVRAGTRLLTHRERHEDAERDESETPRSGSVSVGS